jgi:hypothetical protein
VFGSLCLAPARLSRRRLLEAVLRIDELGSPLLSTIVAGGEDE